MSTAGPELPPHLVAKRKRQAAEEEAARTSQTAQKETQTTSEPAQPASPKRQRIAGPAPPPAPLDQKPTSPATGNDPSDSDSSDDFGPAPPTSATTKSAFDDLPTYPSLDSALQGSGAKSKRDDWMMVPPSHDDLASNMDPTKLRARGFKTGRAGQAPAERQGMGASWLETPEEKKKRLADEVLGIAPSGSERNSRGGSGNSADPARAQKQRENEETARRIGESRARERSLYEGHQVTNGEEIKQKEDDPSLRAFDREKDIGGVKIGHAQRRELLRNAKGFSGKFSGGGFL